MKAKSIVKKVALVMAGVTAITAVCFGVKALVDYTNEDLKTISPSFEVGNLGSDGKYVEDEGALYTKEAFACYGLQIKPDFDAQVEYQIYYYDILDSYVSCTDVLTESFCEEAPLNGAYARLVITPTDDEDGEIGWLEKYTYTNQLTIKVYKEQNLDERFAVVYGKTMQLASNTTELYFEYGLFLNSTTFAWSTGLLGHAASSNYLYVKGSSTVTYDFSNYWDSCSVFLFEFNDIPSNDSFITVNKDGSLSSSFTLNSKTKYVIFSLYISDNESGSGYITGLSNYVTLA